MKPLLIIGYTTSPTSNLKAVEANAKTLEERLRDAGYNAIVHLMTDHERIDILCTHFSSAPDNAHPNDVSAKLNKLITEYEAAMGRTLDVVAGNTAKT